MQNFKNRSVQTCAQNAGSNDFKDIWDSAISSRSLKIFLRLCRSKMIVKVIKQLPDNSPLQFFVNNT